MTEAKNCQNPEACGAPCPMKDGAHQPAEALQQIAEPALQALRERLRFTHMRLGHAEHFVEVRASVVAEVIKLADRQAARIAELEAEKVHKDREQRAAVAEALGLWIGHGNAKFAWSYLHGQIKDLVKCEEELIALRKQGANAQDKVEAQHREELRAYEITVANRDARIAELEAQLEAIGAGGVEPLRKTGGQVLIDFDQVGAAGPFAVVDGRVRLPAETMMDLARMLKPTIDAMEAAPQAVQAAVPLPLLVRDIARDLGITVPQACIALKPLGNYSTNSAVTAEMARMLRDHFPAPAHPAEGVPAQTVPVGYVALAALTSRTHADDYAKCFATEAALLENYPAAKAIAVFDHAATQPAAQGMDAIRALIAQHSKELEHNHYAYFELAYTRRTGWMVWITDKPAFRESVLVNPDRKVLASGQGDTPEAACAAALAAQAKQGGA